MHNPGHQCVVSALLKVEILKANHNELSDWGKAANVVSALLKVEILKANHNRQESQTVTSNVVSALLKVEILKAKIQQYSENNHKLRISLKKFKEATTALNICSSFVQINCVRDCHPIGRRL